MNFEGIFKKCIKNMSENLLNKNFVSEILDTNKSKNLKATSKNWEKRIIKK
jgi:hypothetical protein